MDGPHALQQTIVHRILEKLVKEIWQSQRMKIYMAQRRDIPFSGSVTEQEIPWHSVHWEVEPILLPFAAPRNAAVLGKT